MVNQKHNKSNMVRWLLLAWVPWLIYCDAPTRQKSPTTPQKAPIGRATVGYIREKTKTTDQKKRPLNKQGKLHLDQLVWVISDVELHACERAERFSLIPSAYAHVPDSATRLGAPFVEDLLSPEGKANIVGELAPPYGEYCTMYIIIAPADDDIINTTAISTKQIEGYSYLIKGKRQRQPDGPWEDFEIKGKDKLIFKFALSMDPKGKTPLKINAKESGFLLIDKRIDQALYDQHFGTQTLDTSTLGPNLMRAIGQRLKQYHARTTP